MGRVVAGMVIILAIGSCPTILDAWRAWVETPQHRPLIIGAYIAVAIIALAAGDQLLNR